MFLLVLVTIALCCYRAVFSKPYTVKIKSFICISLCYAEKFWLLCICHTRRKKNQTKSVMFTSGDGTDSCSLMHGALSVSFGGKEAETGECLALLTYCCGRNGLPQGCQQSGSNFWLSQKTSPPGETQEYIITIYRNSVFTVFRTLLSRSGQKHSVGWTCYSSDPKHSCPAGVTTEKENWAFWAKAWWAFTGMWEQRRAFSPYGKHKGLAWLLFLCASWGTVPFVPQKTGLLYHLPLCIVPTPRHWHGKRLLGISRAERCVEMSCPRTSCLAGMRSSSRCHHPASPDTTQLTGCGFSSCHRADHNWCSCLRKVRWDIDSELWTQTDSQFICLLTFGGAEKEEKVLHWRLSHPHLLTSATVKSRCVLGVPGRHQSVLYKDII